MNHLNNIIEANRNFSRILIKTISKKCILDDETNFSEGYIQVTLLIVRGFNGLYETYFCDETGNLNLYYYFLRLTGFFIKMETKM